LKPSIEPYVKDARPIIEKYYRKVGYTIENLLINERKR